jgi:hypothetical protein
MTHHNATQAGRSRLHSAKVSPRANQDPAASRSAQAISAVVIALEEAYAALRVRWPELPAVVITVFYDRHRSVRGYFWDGQWRSQADPFLPELHIDSTILSDPPEAILKTLVHEAAHALARARGIKDTSREGRYHNYRFAELAQEMGLVVEGDVKIGVRTPRLNPEWLAGPYRLLVQVIDAASRRLWQEDHGVTGGSSGNGQNSRTGPMAPTGPKGRLVKAVCQCSPPRIIRAARNTLQAAPIRCAACGGEFSLNTDTLKETSP